MADNLFCKDFSYIEGETIELRLIDTYEGGNGALPFYWWDIVQKTNHAAVGKISLRIGHNYHSYYNGNIGYEVDEGYRGHHYSLLACQLVLKVAQYHNMEKIYLTCDYDNVASCKTIEKLGAKRIEEVLPPKDYIYYNDEMKIHKIYELNIV
ncbi:MAG: GNAT family N-acetyltransferase [Lachnospiraceae bacterium]|nr:GNAT family N-acetyltransferase [Lachnospiraceae bacterium]